MCIRENMCKEVDYLSTEILYNFLFNSIFMISNCYKQPKYEFLINFEFLFCSTYSICISIFNSKENYEEDV